jgi:Domain of unknown function (DUF1611_C) P-loop domain
VEHLAFTSVTRASGLQDRMRSIEPLRRRLWDTGDFVVGEVVAAARGIECPDGRMAAVANGDLVVGALGSRAATLQAVGDWRAIGEAGLMEDMSTAGVFAKCTSISTELGALTTLVYRGHVLVGGEKATMTRWIPDLPAQKLATPTVLIVGTSMEAGKTVAASAIVRRLRARGLRVAGAKLTGVGRFRDILAMKDAGADVVFDFVDAGLPSTICDAEEMNRALGTLFGLVTESAVDVLVAEAGASPLEPYNGDAAVAGIGDALRMTVLCASDPYAVLGVEVAFGLTPDLVSGRAASTDAGIALVERLTGIRTLNLLDQASWPALDELLGEALADQAKAEAAAPPAGAT